ncbi:MAG: polysaccharide deacetylase family protein, partial [Candidatus Hodarchaeota archaeon]
EDFVLLCKNRERIPKKTVVLTFDDGYEGVYLNAYKVLKKFNFPATIFLSCASIGTKKTFPWLPFYETQLSNIPKQMNPWLPLSWQEVQEMSKNSVSFGSHTMTHPEMGNLPEKQIEWEISESKRTIENKIGNNIWLFSYPHSFSGAKIFDRTLLESIKKLLKANGFEAACSTEIGANSQKTDLFTLRRIQIDQTDSLFHFKAKVIGAYNWVRFPQQVFRSIFALVERIRTFKKRKTGTTIV